MKNIIVASVMAVVLTGSNAAWAAGSWMDQHGITCKPVSYHNGGVGWPLAYHADYGSYGSQQYARVSEVGTGSFSPVYCPLVAYSSISDVMAYVWDRSSTADVSCTLYAFDEAGNVQYQQTRGTSGASNTDTFLLHWDDMSGVTVKYASIECSVPKALANDPVGGSGSGVAYMSVVP